MDGSNVARRALNAVGVRAPLLAVIALLLGLGFARSERPAAQPQENAASSASTIGFASVATVPGLDLVSSLSATLAPHPQQAPASQAAPQDAAIVQALIGMLRDTVPALREAAADALEERAGGARAAVPALVTALSDPQRRVRQRAAAALGAIGDPAAVTPLGERLASDPDRGVAQEAAEALGRIGTADAASRLEAALVAASLRDDAFRRTVVQALGRTGQPAAVARLEALFPLADRRLQQTILESFADAGTASSNAALVRMIQSADPNLRLLAVRALGGDATLPQRPR
jgi:HEAT repeat protein